MKIDRKRKNRLGTELRLNDQQCISLLRVVYAKIHEARQTYLALKLGRKMTHQLIISAAEQIMAAQIAEGFWEAYEIRSLSDMGFVVDEVDGTMVAWMNAFIPAELELGDVTFAYDMANTDGHHD